MWNNFCGRDEVEVRSPFGIAPTFFWRKCSEIFFFSCYYDDFAAAQGLRKVLIQSRSQVIKYVGLWCVGRVHRVISDTYKYVQKYQYSTNSTYKYEWFSFFVSYSSGAIFFFFFLKSYILKVRSRTTACTCRAAGVPR